MDGCLYCRTTLFHLLRLATTSHIQTRVSASMDNSMRKLYIFNCLHARKCRLRFILRHPIEYYSSVHQLRVKSEGKKTTTYSLEVFDVTDSCRSFPLLKITSGKATSVLSACWARRGLVKKWKTLRYPCLASGVRPNRTKKTSA